MGNPSYSDNSGLMCYNPAKNYQIARGSDSWYNENDHETITWDSGNNAGSYWSGTIIGIADYKNNPYDRPVVVKIESGTSDDLFVGFNRAIGINRDMTDARDKVTITEAGNNGLGYAQSWIKASLSEGESYRVVNWRGSGIDMTIYVKKIDLGAKPAYADVIMSLGDPTVFSKTNSRTPNPTRNPTLRPTTQPTANPTKTRTVQPTVQPTRQPTIQPSMKPTVQPTKETNGNELETTFEYDLGSGGSMFTVEAKQNILITSLAINSNSRGAGEVKIYTREGGYSGHVNSSDGWELIYDNPSAMHSRRGQATELGDFEQGVRIAKGMSQSFFVSSSKGLVYKSGDQENSSFTSDQSLSILEGIGTDESFSDMIHTPRVWSGIIR